jgi:hypothetical protein
MQRACAILSSVTCTALQYFSTLSNKRHDFRKKKKKVPNPKCVCWFYLRLLSQKFYILRINERDMITNVYWSSCKSHVRFYRQLNFLWTDFRKILKYQNLWKSVQLEPSLSMRTDGQTDMTKLIVAFRNFANAPKNGYTEAASMNFVTFFKTTTSKGISSCYSLPVYKKGMRPPLTSWTV